MPAMTDKIFLSVWDWDAVSSFPSCPHSLSLPFLIIDHLYSGNQQVGKNEIVGTCVLSLKALAKGKKIKHLESAVAGATPHWVNLYGSPTTNDDSKPGLKMNK